MLRVQGVAVVLTPSFFPLFCVNSDDAPPPAPPVPADTTAGPGHGLQPPSFPAEPPAAEHPGWAHESPQPPDHPAAAPAEDETAKDPAGEGVYPHEARGADETGTPALAKQSYAR